MNKVIRLMFLVMVNQVVCYNLGVDNFQEAFWVLVASMSGIIYGLSAMFEAKVNYE